PSAVLAAGSTAGPGVPGVPGRDRRVSGGRQAGRCARTAAGHARRHGRDGRGAAGHPRRSAATAADRPGRDDRGLLRCPCGGQRLGRGPLGRRGSQATGLYNLAYYAGSSVLGWRVGLVYEAWGWGATVAVVLAVI